MYILAKFDIRKDYFKAPLSSLTRGKICGLNLYLILALVQFSEGGDGCSCFLTLDTLSSFKQHLNSPENLIKASLLR